MSGFINGQLTLDNEGLATSATNNDVTVTGSLLFVTVTNNNDTITGIQAPTGGALLFVVNTGPTNNLIIANQSASSQAANQIQTYTGVDLTVPPFQTALLGYDLINSVWHVTKFA